MNSTYKIEFTKKALKSFSKLTRKKQEQISEIISKLEVNPFVLPNIKPLQGSLLEDYRVRIGTLRLIYRIEQQRLVIIVLDLGSRGDIYK